MLMTPNKRHYTPSEMANLIAVSERQLANWRYNKKVRIPYAGKIFFQEMASIGISIRLRLDDEFANAI